MLQVLSCLSKLGLGFCTVWWYMCVHLCHHTTRRQKKVCLVENDTLACSHQQGETAAPHRIGQLLQTIKLEYPTKYYKLSLEAELHHKHGVANTIAFQTQLHYRLDRIRGTISLLFRHRHLTPADLGICYDQQRQTCMKQEHP